jgi:hypothetical protein
MSAQQNLRSTRPIVAPRAEAEQLSTQHLVVSMQGKQLDRRLAHPAPPPLKDEAPGEPGCFEALHPMEILAFCRVGRQLAKNSLTLLKNAVLRTKRPMPTRGVRVHEGGPGRLRFTSEKSIGVS